MVELRWLERDVSDKYPGTSVVRTERVLQYRTLVWSIDQFSGNISSSVGWNENGPAPSWSDWQDVPTVGGEGGG